MILHEDNPESVLFEAASEVFLNAYAPYSRFRVGAALEDDRGVVWKGCNVEVASFGATSCAERSALFAAVSSGSRGFRAIFILTDSPSPTAPCGICRQALAEFSPDLLVISATLGGARSSWTLSDLFPARFGPADLPESRG